MLHCYVNGVLDLSLLEDYLSRTFRHADELDSPAARRAIVLLVERMIWDALPEEQRPEWDAWEAAVLLVDWAWSRLADRDARRKDRAVAEAARRDRIDGSGRISRHLTRSRRSVRARFGL